MRAAAALLGLLAAAGCAELQRPPPPEPPATLTGGAVLRPAVAIVGAAARAFAAPAGLPAGQPAEVALAVARLEWLGAAAAPGGPLMATPETDQFALGLAVQESRAAFGIAADAPSERAVAALLAARAALLRGDRAAAAAALGPPVFRAAPPLPLARLEEPPPLPVAAQALASLGAAVDRAAAGRDIGPTGLIDQNAASGAGIGVPQMR